MLCFEAILSKALTADWEQRARNDIIMSLKFRAVGRVSFVTKCTESGGGF